MNDFLTVYIKAFEQFKQNWLTISGWTVIWSLLPIIYISYLLSLSSDLVLRLSAGLPAVSGAEVFFIIVVILIIFASPLSFAYLGDSTSRGKTEDSFLRAGIYGITHPWASFTLIITWVIVYFVISLIFSLIWGAISIVVAPLVYKLPFMAYVLLLIPAAFIFAVSIVYIFSTYNVVNQRLDALTAIKTTRMQLRGWYLHALGLMVPFFIVSFLLSSGASVINNINNSNRILESKLALEALEIEPEKAPTNSEFANLLKYTTFHEKKPVYEGDFDEYKHQLAEYAVSFEKFQANKNHTPLPDDVQDYLEPTSHRGLAIVLFILMAIFMGGFAYGICVTSQMYRTINGEIEDEKSKEEKEKRRNELITKRVPGSPQDPSPEPDTPGLLHSKRPEYQEEPPKPAESKEDAADPATPSVQPSQQPTQPPPLPNSTHINISASRADAIDPGFDLKF